MAKKRKTKRQPARKAPARKRRVDVGKAAARLGKRIEGLRRELNAIKKSLKKSRKKRL